MESKLTDYVNRLKDGGRANLKAVVLYGSAVTGEFRAGHSDLNTLCIVGRATSQDLEDLHPAAEWWARQGNHPPLVFTLDELTRSADVFAIELLDMKQSHRILFGEDFLTNLDVPLRQHRLQVERELRTNWLRLRQTVLTAPLSHKAHLAIMSQSVSAFCALFRHALLAVGQPMPATKREAVAAIAAFTGADPSGFNSMLDLREGTKKPGQVDVEGSLNSYVEFVEIVTNEVDRRLDVM
jgi:predicted nucleotidyltransferase